MKNLKISMKLIVSFAIVIVFAVVIGIVGIVGMDLLKKSSEELYDSNVVAISAMADLREVFSQERNDLRNLILTRNDPQATRNIINGFAAYEKIANEAFVTYEKTITDESAETAYYTAKDVYNKEFSQVKNDIFALATAGDYDGAYDALRAGSALVAPIAEGLTSSAALNDTWALESNTANDALSKTLSTVLIIVLVVVVIISMLMAYYIARLISGPLTILTAFMKKAGSTGDITLSPEDVQNISSLAQNRDEIGQCIGSTSSFLSHMTNVGKALETVANGDLTISFSMLSDKDVMGTSLNKMIDNLNKMFSEIHSSAVQVSDGSKQIASGAQSLAQGSTEQASATEQLSSSISEVFSQTKANTEMAVKAAELAEQIKSNAERGSGQMSSMTLAVEDINQSSQSISKVIKVIDDIAFQTNILALNAAVEAARAGQHGKGFAVVAEEVRNLAAKSAEAAKDTASLIEGSMQKAELGVQISNETAESLNLIVSEINESTQLVGDIAKSSEMQSAAIAQINQGIEQVAQVVQQNSATSEESAAASEELSGQSSMLDELVSQFKLKSSMDTYALNEPSKVYRMPSPNHAESRVASLDDGFGKY